MGQTGYVGCSNGAFIKEAVDEINRNYDFQ
jgi:hypothetical protein